MSKDDVEKRKKLIKITIIRNGRKDRVFFPYSSKELVYIADGYRADHIRLELDFNKMDVKNMIEFLKIAEYCFD